MQYHFSDNRICIVDPELDYFLEETIDKIDEIDCGVAPKSIGWTRTRLYHQAGSEKVLLSESIYKDGMLHGPQRIFYPVTDNQALNLASEIQALNLASEIWYKMGMRHGRSYFWHPKTHICIQNIPFKDGKCHGVSRYWTPSGVLSGAISFENGKLHGSATRFHPMGAIPSRQQTWKNGARDGIDVLYYAEDGFLLFCDDWKDGIKVQTYLEDLLEKNLHSQIQKKEIPNKKKLSV